MAEEIPSACLSFKKVDGYLARNYNMGSVFGSILDPAADKALMTTLTIALAVKGLLPVWLAVLILGRDVALSLSAFYFRYISLPEPVRLPCMLSRSSETDLTGSADY